MTAVFLAGGEVETLTRALLDNGVKHILYSYYYILQMKRGPFIQRMQDEYPDVKWFLDSGAFTYWAQYKANPGKLVPWRKYRAHYMNYIEETWDRWCRVTELDLDHSIDEITLDVLAEWRDEMFERWPNAPIMPVWHTNRGPEEWTHYCRDARVKHLAIGSGQPDVGLVRRMVIEAHRRNKTVHGFGMTRVNTGLQYIPYDSVDSSSWLMGQKYGTMFIFRNNKFTLLGKDGPMGKNARKFFVSYFRKIGCDPVAILNDEIAEVRKANVIAWRNVSARLQEIRKRQNRTLFDKDPEELEEKLNPSYPWDAPSLRGVDSGTRVEVKERSPTDVPKQAKARGDGNLPGVPTGARPRDPSDDG